MTLRSSAGCAGRRTAGFTLIEMVVVIAILGLALAVVAGFAPRRHGRLALDTAASGVAEALRSARTGAIARAEPVLFAPVAGGKGYAVGGTVRLLPPSVVLAASGVIRFAPDGSSSGGTVRLASDAGARVFRVDWLTGRAAAADGQ